MKLDLDDSDQSTLLAYKKSVERKRGYTGPCFVDAGRLAEIHMSTAQLITQVALYRSRQASKE